MNAVEIGRTSAASSSGSVTRGKMPPEPEEEEEPAEELIMVLASKLSGMSCVWCVCGLLQTKADELPESRAKKNMVGSKIFPPPASNTSYIYNILYK